MDLMLMQAKQNECRNFEFFQKWPSIRQNAGWSNAFDLHHHLLILLLCIDVF